jgi:hypothetical protein
LFLLLHSSFPGFFRTTKKIVLRKIGASNDSASRGCPVLLMLARKYCSTYQSIEPQPNRIYYLSKVMGLPCPHRFFRLHVSLSPIILHATANNPHAKKQNKVLNFWVCHRPTPLNFNFSICSRCSPYVSAEYLFVSINLVVSLLVMPDSPFALHVD